MNLASRRGQEKGLQGIPAAGEGDGTSTAAPLAGIAPGNRKGDPRLLVDPRVFRCLVGMKGFEPSTP